MRLQAVLVPTVGTVQVASMPPGAEVFVNGLASGHTPATVRDLAPNVNVEIELRLRGYKIAHRSIPWQGRRALSVDIPLEKAR